MSETARLAALAVPPVVEAIRPLLAGRPPHIQSAALADLTAIWLAGYAVPGNPAETQALRDDLLGEFVAAVKSLVPVNAGILGTDK